MVKLFEPFGGGVTRCFCWRIGKTFFGASGGKQGKGVLQLGKIHHITRGGAEGTITWRAGVDSVSMALEKVTLRSNWIEYMVPQVPLANPKCTQLIFFSFAFFVSMISIPS